LSKALARIPSGIHRLELTLSNSTDRIEHSLWYWKGLEDISTHSGFRCRERASNININASRGVCMTDHGIRVLENYRAPTITIALSAPAVKLSFRVAGVRVVLREPGDDWEEQASLGSPVVVLPDDRRIVRFESGGFERWEIVSSNRIVTELTSKRPNYVISLAGIATELGGSGVIEARGTDGRRIPLLKFIRPLTASSPNHSLDHVANAETWKFRVSVQNQTAIGVAITEMSDVPDPPMGEIVAIAENVDGVYSFDEVRFGAATIVINSYPEVNSGNQSGVPSGSFVRVKVTISIARLEHRLWAIDFFRREAPDGEWTPLESVEPHTYSTLRLFAWGSDVPPESGKWWPHLRRAERVNSDRQRDPALAASIRGMSLLDLENSLRISRRLLGWKYPSAVWKENAHRLQEMPVHLGIHRFDPLDDSAAVWWEQGSIELAEHASSTAAPIVRQFLYASQPTCLRLPRRRLKIQDAANSPVGRSLNLPAAIQAAGGLQAYIVPAVGREEINSEVIHCYDNFVAVHTGSERDFRGFSLVTFLMGGVAGIKGLSSQAVGLTGNAARFEVRAILSPEHLLYCIRPLNRRCRAVFQATQAEEFQSLSGISQAIERMSQRLQIVAPSLRQKIGWNDPGESWWTPPLIENPIAEKVVGLIWCVAAISRLAANQKIAANEFDEQMRSLLCPGDYTDRTLQNKVCILLSMAPELLTFYLALFELPFAPENLR
jgi:hypothetical protein